MANYTKREKLMAAITSAALSVMSSPAFALGGLDKAKSTTEDIKTGLYALVGVGSAIYLLYIGIMAFTEKKSWSDFGWAVVHVAVVGASITLAGWAWSAFS